MPKTGSRITVMGVCGTRPEAIKMAPVAREFARHAEDVRFILAATGQHREMLAQVLDLFGLTPDYHLDIMSQRQTLVDITNRTLQGLSAVIGEAKPDLVLAQGDTTTTFTAALASFYAKVAFGHIEAGLRTDNKYEPFPEEINRRLTSVMCDLHFAPTERAKRSLMAEGIDKSAVFVTGNTVIDALHSIADMPYEFEEQALRTAAKSNRLILLTTHRRESWGEPMRSICAAVRDLVRTNPDVTVVFPVHKNPVVRDVVFPELEHESRVLLVEPLDYLPFVHLMKRAHVVLTDSGGVQEEAPALGKPVLVLRNTTERPEGIDAGCAKLVGTDAQVILEETQKLLEDEHAYTQMAQVKNPYGDGQASQRIFQIVADHIGYSN